MSTDEAKRLGDEVMVRANALVNAYSGHYPGTCEDAKELRAAIDRLVAMAQGVKKGEAAHMATLIQRDMYHDIADELAERIANITGREIGEHSSNNDPWMNAKDAADEYMALLPQVPKPQQPQPASHAGSRRRRPTTHQQGARVACRKESCPMTQALKALEEREDDGVCLGCNGAGSVRAMTSHLGPGDYEYDEECAACNGSGSPYLKDALESVGVICHPQWPSRLYMNREQVMRIADARAALAQQEAQASPTMDDALAVGDGTLHSAVDYWQKRALAAEGVRDVNETNNVLANNYIELCAKLEEAQAADFPPLESGRWTAEQKRIVTLMVERARGEAQAAEVSVCETFTAPLVGCVAVVRQAAEVVLPAAAFEPDVPDYHSEAMGCGLEDRGIRDRYDAMQYGWTEGVDRTLELIPDDLYTADQVREAVLLDRAGRGVEK